MEVKLNHFVIFFVIFSDMIEDRMFSNDSDADCDSYEIAFLVYKPWNLMMIQ